MTYIAPHLTSNYLQILPTQPQIT